MNDVSELNARSKTFFVCWERGVAVVAGEARDGRLRDAVVGQVSRIALSGALPVLSLPRGVRPNADVEKSQVDNKIYVS